jgi:hypothetical protein
MVRDPNAGICQEPKPMLMSQIVIGIAIRFFSSQPPASRCRAGTAN